MPQQFIVHVIRLIQSSEHSQAGQVGTELLECIVNSLVIANLFESDRVLVAQYVGDHVDTGGGKQVPIGSDGECPLGEQRLLRRGFILWLIESFAKGIFSERIAADFNFNPDILFLVDDFPDHESFELMAPLIRFSFHQLADCIFHCLDIGDLKGQQPAFAGWRNRQHGIGQQCHTAPRVGDQIISQVDLRAIGIFGDSADDLFKQVFTWLGVEQFVDQRLGIFKGLIDLPVE